MAKQNHPMDSERIRVIFEQTQGPEVRQALEQYIMTDVYPLGSCGSEERRREKIGLALDAAMRRARSRGCVKPCHNARVNASAWPEEKKELFRKYFLEGASAEEIFEDPRFKADAASFKSVDNALGNVAKSIGITLKDRKTRKGAMKNRKAASESKGASDEIKPIALQMRPIVDRGRTTVAALSSQLDISKETVIKALECLQSIYREEEGAILSVSGKIRGSVEKIIPKMPDIVTSFPGWDSTFRILVLSQTLLGNKYQQMTLLTTLMHEAEKVGVKFAVVVGGAVAGKPTKGTWGELFLHTAGAQAAYVHRYWPHVNFKTYFLAGDEELSFGQNVAEMFCGMGREDLRYLGAWSACLPVSNTDTLLQFLYPKGGVKRTYTIGYRPQKGARAILASVFPKIRSGGANTLPRITFNGRVMAQGEINRGMKTVFCPGLLDRSPSLEAAEVMPSIGGIIAELHFDNEGHFLPDFDADGKAQEGGTNMTYWDLTPYATANDYGEFNNDCANCTPHEKKALALLKEHPLTVGEISRQLNCSTETVEHVMDSLRAKGFDVEFSSATKRFVRTPVIKDHFESLVIPTKEVLRFATTSDIHYGSKHQQPELVRMAHAYARDVWHAPVMLNTGDNHDGKHVFRGQESEVFADGFDDQLKVAVKEWPADPKTIAIAGNHDESFWKSITADLARHFHLEENLEITKHADIMRQLSLRRPEITYLGSARVGEFCTEAKAIIDIHGNIIENDKTRGLLVLFLHPRGAVGQFRTLKPQKFVENLTEEIASYLMRNADSANIPHVFLMGNWHINAYVRYGGVDVYIVPTFQAQTRFLKELGLTPDIGSWMVAAETDANQHIVRNRVHYLDLVTFVKDRDY